MKRINYRKFLAIGLLVAMIFAISGCTKGKEGLVAKVDGEGITIEEFESDFEVYKKIYEQRLGEGAMSEVGEDGKTLEENLKNEIVQKLIMEKLVAKEATKMDISVTDEEIEEQMLNYTTMMGGQEKFDEFLDNNKISKEFFKENLRKEILFNKHRETFMAETNISEKEAQKYFNANKDDLVVIKASHILVKTEEEGKKILERLNAGEKFDVLAKDLSIDKASAVNGGDLGYFTKGSMISEFEEVAFNLKVGEISDLVKTEVGYHIIYLEDRKDTFETLKDDIMKLLKEQKYLKSVQDLRSSAKVKVYLDSKDSKKK
ncbi:peptidylprolyl isomerase [Tissierella sp. MB52-C2]|uniref:peptidylprolyl isomerase n=1 Tax=Tissierella sp. MB52-C2 TaxID=3070999 RepID=UPI00280BF9D2|nr:peptidylprolyl isomerase [Tissierella sp. MB52-C2]WMM25404.1 peptidylprolyl isomerase [Tissierella sp. MB52-C2]